MTRAFDVEAYIARVPAHAMVKGMFWHDLEKVARSVGAELPPARRTAFTDYPLAEYMRAVADVARLATPSEPLAEGIRQLGKRAFLTFSTSLTGRVLLAIAGRSITVMVRKPTVIRNMAVVAGDEVQVMRHEVARLLKHRMVVEI